MTRKCGTRGAGVIVGLGFAVLSLLLAPAAVDAAPCGPGAHWVDACPSGTDTLSSSAQLGILVIDPDDGGGLFNMPLMRGLVIFFRGAGTTIPDHHIPTEMVSLQLSGGGGVTLVAGDGLGNLLNDGPLHSPGRITELVNPFLADSFFDVFFELDGTPFGPLHNTSPCRTQTVIDQVPPPPGTAYLCTTDPIDLFDAGGVHRAILTGGVTLTIEVAEPATLLLLGLGLAGVGTLCKRRRA